MDEIDQLLELLDYRLQMSERVDIWIKILEQICLHLGMTSAYMMRHDFERKMSTLVSQYISTISNSDELDAYPGETFWEEEFPTTMRWLKADTAHPHVVHADELSSDDPELAEYNESDIKTAVFFKLFVEEQVWGYLELWNSRRKREFTQDELGYGEQICAKLSATIAT
jgi:GAF domain-containing protein